MESKTERPKTAVTAAVSNSDFELPLLVSDSESSLSSQFLNHDNLRNINNFREINNFSEINQERALFSSRNANVNISVKKARNNKSTKKVSKEKNRQKKKRTLIPKKMIDFI